MHGDGRIFVDGTPFAPGSAQVAVLDHGYLYGDGVFETIRTYGGRLFRLEAHVARLLEGLAEVHIGGAPSASEIASQVLAALDAAGLPEAYCRITVTRGVGTRGLDPAGCSKATLVVAILPLRTYPDAVYATGMKAIVLWPRHMGDRPPPSVKSTSYQRGVLARIEIARRGVGEGFFLDEAGNVTEGSVCNVFAIEGNTLATPPPNVCLRGITRAEVLALAAAQGMRVVEEPLSVARLSAADEVFVTSSLAELVPIVRIEEKVVGSGTPGPAHKLLLARYRETANQAHAPSRTEKRPTA
jgi:branched-chain amino acid aminotransferase